MTCKECGSLEREFSSSVFYFFSFNELNLIPFKYLKENGHEGLGVEETGRCWSRDANFQM